MSRVKDVAEAGNSYIRAFLQLVLLSQGKVVYSGRTDEVVPYFARQGFLVPNLTNLVEYFFHVWQCRLQRRRADLDRLDRLTEAWRAADATGEFHKSTGECPLSQTRRAAAPSASRSL
jgi:hypothetical protein